MRTTKSDASTCVYERTVGGETVTVHTKRYFKGELWDIINSTDCRLQGKYFCLHRRASNSFHYDALVNWPVLPQGPVEDERLRNENVLKCAAVFVRCVFAIPSCIHLHPHGILALWCGDSGKDWRRVVSNCRSTLSRFQSLNYDWDQMHHGSGPLFADYWSSEEIDGQNNSEIPEVCD